MVRAGQGSYLVRQKLLPHHKDLLQLVPPLLRPATHSSPALTQRLYTGEKKTKTQQKHSVSQLVMSMNAILLYHYVTENTFFFNLKI